MTEQGRLYYVLAMNGGGFQVVALRFAPTWDLICGTHRYMARAVDFDHACELLAWHVWSAGLGVRR